MTIQAGAGAEAEGALEEVDRVVAAADTAAGECIAG